MENKITIFTPTYNRAYTLPALYHSLLRQTNPNFQWLIVDDGSNDETADLIQKWIDSNRIAITYYFQENGGKQRAHNTGVLHCDTELFVCIDSDDYLTDDAIEKLYQKWSCVEYQEKVCGIVAMRGSDLKKPIGNKLPSEPAYSTLWDLYHKYGFKGDTVLLYRTKVLKQYPFPVADGEKFIGETYVYRQIDQKYVLCLLQEIICICNYLPDGYTNNIRKIIKQNPIGYMTLNRQETIYATTLKDKFLGSIKYMVGGILCGENHLIRNAPYKMLALFAYIPATLYVALHYR